MSAVSISLLPVSVEVDGARVTILEILPIELPNGEKRYVAICKAQWRDITTRNFPVFFATEQEFKEKIRTEVAKVKMTAVVHGIDFARRAFS